MAINIYELFLNLKSNTNTKQGGQLRVRDFNNWVNQISIQLFNEKFAAWEKDQMLVDNLSRPFLESKSFVTTKTALNHCLLPYPNGYSYFSSARVYKKSDGEVVKCPEPGTKGVSAFANLCEVTVTKVTNAQWGAVCDNKLIPPTTNRVRITQYEGGFKIAPKEIGYITLDYLRLPKKAKLVTTGINQTYDAVNSIDLEWNETVVNEFLSRLQIAYSEFIREQFLYSAGQNKKETTI